MFLKKRANAIKKAMLYKHTNQKKIAQHLGISESYVTRLINGERYYREFEIFIRYELGVSYTNFR